MAHPEYWNLIDEYAEGTLDDADRRRLDGHLATCQFCRQHLEAARHEVQLLQRAFAPAQPPVQFAANVMAKIESRPTRTLTPFVRGIGAGILANCLTAAILVLLSLGTGTSLLLILSIAFVGAVLWGGLKGVAFAAVIRFLPKGILGRGVLFGFGICVCTNLCLAVLGGFGVQADFTPAFLLIGSAVHDLGYGLLLSWLYDRLRGAGHDSGFPFFGKHVLVSPTLSGVMGFTLIFGPSIAWITDGHVTPHQVSFSANISVAREDSPPRLGTPTPTPFAATTETPAAPVTPTLGSPPQTGTPLPALATVTVTASVGIPRATVGSTPTSTVRLAGTPSAIPTSASATPAPTSPATPAPTSPARHPARHASKSVTHQVRTIFSAVLAPSHSSTVTQRARSVVVLLNFL